MTDLEHRPVRIRIEELRRRLNDDAEFTLAARYLDARIRLEVGPRAYQLRVLEGVVTRATDVDTGFDPYDLLVGGPEAAWAEILALVPRPFYQDFWSAKARHEFSLAGDLDLLCAYYGAVRRMGDILRQMREEGMA